MAYDKFFAIGDKVQVIEGEEIYTSRIENFVGDSGLIIYLPLKGRIALKFEKNKNYRMLLYSKSAVYKGEFRVMDQYKEGAVPLVEILIMSELEKEQRREYFRIDYISPIRYKVIQIRNTNTGELEDYDDEFHSATMTNISGGGMRFNTEVGNIDARKVQVCFQIKSMYNSYDFTFDAEIVGIKKKDDSDKNLDYRIKFLNIEKGDRETIVKFIFDKEREMRRKSAGKI